MTDRKPCFEDFYRIIRRIPHGCVATYGQIAGLAGYPRHARYVGQALRSLAGSATAIPWHRVVNAQGTISRRGLDGSDDLQRRLLDAEGIAFDERGRIDMRRCQWPFDRTR